MEYLNDFFTIYFPYFLLGLITSFFLIRIYLYYSKKFNIFAEVNNRSLHSRVTPTSAGVIFFFSFLAFWLIEFFFLNFNVFNNLSFNIILCFSFILLGAIDDKYNLLAKKKFLYQSIITIVILFFFFMKNESFTFILNNFLIYILCVFLLLSFINTFNFLDGIDGMALSTAFFSIFTFLLFFMYLDQSKEFIFMLGLIFVLCIFNLKKIFFIGDSGSLFLGGLIGLTIINGIIYSNWDIILILILLSYWLTDVTLTFTIRFIFIKKWYETHTMHPYQNFSKYINSHFITVSILFLYNIFYILPIGILCYNDQAMKYFYLILAYLPCIVFCIFFGPFKNLVQNKQISLSFFSKNNR